MPWAPTGCHMKDTLPSVRWRGFRANSEAKQNTTGMIRNQTEAICGPDTCLARSACRLRLAPPQGSGPRDVLVVPHISLAPVRWSEPFN